MLKHTYSLVWSTQSRAAEADVENEGVAHVLLVSMWHMSEKSSRSTLNTAVSSRVQWPQADRSVWPHSSLRRSPSTPAQRESGCCSSCTDRPSPGAQRCSPETCFSRSASSSGSSLTGSPCWPHTPVSLSSLRRSLHWRAAGRSLQDEWRLTNTRESTQSRTKHFSPFRFRKIDINNTVIVLLIQW